MISKTDLFNAGQQGPKYGIPCTKSLTVGVPPLVKVTKIILRAVNIATNHWSKKQFENFLKNFLRKNGEFGVG